MACVDLPSFPLQLLLRRHPEWRGQPAVVVDSDRPQGTILWVNERARALRVLPGMRYASGLSLAGALRAAVVPAAEIEQETAALGERLRRWTPHVEPGDEPGLFWLDARGLERLHDSLRNWADEVRCDLRQVGLDSCVVVGFTRFGTYALARAKRGVVVLRSASEERAAAQRVPLDRLAIEPAARDALAKLGVTTVGRFADLPSGGIGKRFGSKVLRLHRLASGELNLPLQPERPDPPAMRRRILDHPETRVDRLLVVIERLLASLMRTVEEKGRALAEVQLGFRFERLGDHIETVRPAAPTQDTGALLELIRLRLQSVRKLPDGVMEVVLAAKETEAVHRQAELPSQRKKRDSAAAGRALARIRASFGDDAVVQARLREAHLPEGSYAWEPLDQLPAARPRDLEGGRLVRRIHTRPIPLPRRPRHEPDGWMPRGLEQGPVVRVLGPYSVSGGWWARPVHRDYHFAESGNGDLMWVYYDRAQRRWYLHGRVD